MRMQRRVGKLRGAKKNAERAPRCRTIVKEARDFGKSMIQYLGYGQMSPSELSRREINFPPPLLLGGRRLLSRLDHDHDPHPLLE